jgi:hypothetical protein
MESNNYAGGATDATATAAADHGMYCDRDAWIIAITTCTFAKKCCSGVLSLTTAHLRFFMDIKDCWMPW